MHSAQAGDAAVSSRAWSCVSTYTYMCKTVPSPSSLTSIVFCTSCGRSSLSTPITCCKISAVSFVGHGIASVLRQPSHLHAVPQRRRRHRRSPDPDIHVPRRATRVLVRFAMSEPRSGLRMLKRSWSETNRGTDGDASGPSKSEVIDLCDSPPLHESSNTHEGALPPLTQKRSASLTRAGRPLRSARRLRRRSMHSSAPSPVLRVPRRLRPSRCPKRSPRRAT